MRLEDELEKAIDLAAAGEKAKAAKANLEATNQALAAGTVSKEQLKAAIEAYTAVGDHSGAARFKVALGRLTSGVRP